MITVTQDMLDYLKVRTPFYDRYVLTKDAKEDKRECIIDRVYTNQVYHVFSLILRESKPEEFASNLLAPDKWIDPTREAVKKRKKTYKTNDIRQMDITEHRTEAALRGTNEQTIRKALKEAHEILFETEFDDLPLVAHIQGWQFLIQFRYEHARAEQLKVQMEAPTRTLEAEPKNLTTIGKRKRKVTIKAK